MTPRRQFIASVSLLSALVAAGVWWYVSTLSRSSADAAERVFESLAGLASQSSEMVAADAADPLTDFTDFHETVSRMSDAVAELTRSSRSANRAAAILPSSLLPTEDRSGEVQAGIASFLEAQSLSRTLIAVHDSFAEVLKYDPAVDLRGVSAEQYPQELARRMYLARAGLGRAEAFMREYAPQMPNQALWTDLLERTSRARAVTAEVIQAVDSDEYGAADFRTQEFVAHMTGLQNDIRRYIELLDTPAEFRALAGRASSERD